MRRRRSSGTTAAGVAFLAFACALAAAEPPAIVPTSQPAAGSDWPQWRGPTGCGNTRDASLPVSWGGKEGANVLWKAELPSTAGISPSSPIVVGESVIVTTSLDKPAIEHHVVCYSRKDGKLLWQTPVEPGPIKQIDGRASSAAPTPCSDGQSVFALFGSGVLAAVDLKDGREKWRQELKDTAFDCVIGNSPILCAGSVLFVADQYKEKSAVYAWDPATGQLKYQQKRPAETFCHSTPIVVKMEGKEQVIYAGNKALQGLDPLTGKVLWWVSGQPGQWMGESASPAFGGGLIYSDNGRGNGGAAYQPGGAGDMTKTAVRAGFPCKSDIGSPIIVGEYVYRNIGDQVQCMELRTGKMVYTQPLKGIHAWASPVATADRLYFATAGKSYVFTAGPKFELLGEGDLGDSNAASPAVSAGRLFLKGTKHLWCVGEEK
ncbi:MAG TPA: PQQ-binding-like beta-propeller repeat protein [Phycisphaerae bacterium]|nr:PQQ-binding-like beta-propeller repeat protein [Phycisphaerae bacterium]